MTSSKTPVADSRCEYCTQNVAKNHDHLSFSFFGRWTSYDSLKADGAASFDELAYCYNSYLLPASAVVRGRQTKDGRQTVPDWSRHTNVDDSKDQVEIRSRTGNYNIFLLLSSIKSN